MDQRTEESAGRYGKEKYFTRRGNLAGYLGVVLDDVGDIQLDRYAHNGLSGVSANGINSIRESSKLT
jgi:hypothetical protein